MKRLISRINHQLSLINEDVSDASYKDFNDPGYDRQTAEDALYHTIGPLTDTPRWSESWTSRGTTPVPGFVPNGPAPQWTKDELIMAYAGDPSLLEGDTKANPRSPKYGRAGGAPLYRLVTRVLRQYQRTGDFQAMSNAYNNGLFGLLQMMRRGKDESRSPFISFAQRSVLGAITSGVGASLESIRAIGGLSKSGTRGLKSVIESDDPSEVRDMANQVKGEYRTSKSDDMDPDNPFGVYSSRYYTVAMRYADALESDDEIAIDNARQDINELINTIKDESIAIRGIGTGSEQAISTPDRATSVPISSIDAGKKGEEGSRTAAANIAEPETESTNGIEPEAITYVLQMTMEHDLGATIGMIPRYKQMAIDAGAKIVDGNPVIGGRLTANELRYVIRTLGPIGLNYPGAGNVRSNLTIARDKPGWWKAGDDPEIEPIPTGGIWTSIWKRSGGPAMGATAIANEMTEEVKELNNLNIKTARSVKTKIGKGGASKEEAISKIAVHTAMTSAFVKLKIAAYLYKIEQDEDDDLNESLINKLRSQGVLLKEDIDPIDRKLINEAYDFIMVRLRDSIISEYITRTHNR